MDEDSIYSIQTRSFQFSPLFAVDCHTNLFHFSLKWKLDKCVWFFFFNCRKLWLEVPGWFGQGSAPRLACTTLRAEEHPDEIHKKNPRYLPMKNQPNSIFFQAFLEEKKERRKTFLDPPPTIIQKRTAVLMDLCLEKRSKQKTKHDFHQFSPPTRIFAIFSRITIKKKSEQVTVIVSIKTKQKKNLCENYKILISSVWKKKWLPNVQTSFG